MIEDEVEACQTILKYIEEYNDKYQCNPPKQPQDIVFQYSDVGVHWGTLMKLSKKRIIDIKWTSNSGAHYYVPDITKLQEYIELAKQPKIQEPQQLKDPDFSDIIGHEYAKQLINLALTTLKKYGTPVHILLIGPPASAKSMFLEAFVAVGGRYVSMVSATKAGLRDALTSSIPPYLCVDEIDKASREDTEIFLELLQRGTITITMSNKTTTVDAKKLIVIATANDIDKLSQPLKSRFIIVKTRELNKEEKIQLTKQLLETNKIQSSMTAEEIVQELGELWNARLIHKIVQLAKVSDMKEVIQLIKLANLS